MNQHDWHRLSDSNREVWCKELLPELPSGFAFVGLRAYELGGRVGSVGQFVCDGRVFLFVPGGDLELGFDPGSWTPSDDELLSYRLSCDDFGIQESIHEYLNRVTLRPRWVTVPSLLVEQRASEPGWTEIDEAKARRLMGKSFPNEPRNVEVYDLERVRARIADDGRVVYAQANGETHADIVRRIAPFRLPTSDEWEHLCGGGVRTLFRWGDHVPCDLYPTDISREEAAWKRKWAMSAGALAKPTEAFVPEFDLHRQPNPYGVIVSESPYHAELLSESGLVRGGDGGCSICGGMGFWLGWSPLATAYFERDVLESITEAGIEGNYTRVRRVLSLER